MPIRRTNRLNQKKWLKENNHLKILDLGCSNVNFWPEANNFADIDDHFEHFKKLNLNYTQISPNKKLPFKDKEFDFVVASHVMEHVEDIDFFIKELERVSKKGYIELPTKLEDNLVFENKKDHLWHMDFDDVENKLLISKKVQYFEPILTVSTIKKLNGVFRSSLILELIWEDKINYIVNQSTEDTFKKISILNLFKKYFSKRLRMLFK